MAYDRAGLGASEPDRSPAPTLAAQVADLAALVRHLDAGPSPEVPVTVLSATLGLPRGLRARFTAAQARITAGAVLGVHLVVPGAGHAVHQDRPGVVAEAVRAVSRQVRIARKA
ncbi:hypothetical protein ACFWXO_00625 [Kitasatospora sp. NPDC059088]|uniref:hypothetical protein n=1 Tax=Kitasatospora sp. NPDC059088 TaxID=3346722 RepID=UPI0036A6AFEC